MASSKKDTKEISISSLFLNKIIRWGLDWNWEIIAEVLAIDYNGMAIKVIYFDKHGVEKDEDRSPKVGDIIFYPNALIPEIRLIRREEFKLLSEDIARKLELNSLYDDL